jgi:hypothetical protein
MFLRPFIAAAMALLVTGCTGWWSETRLIPATARDSAGLEGVFVSDEGRMIFSPTAQGLVRASDPAGRQPPSEVAFALLREVAPQPSTTIEAEPAEGELPLVVIPDRAYLMEIAVENEEGNTGYLYAIARIGFAEGGAAEQIEVVSPLCSNASEKFAARKEYEACVFDDYGRLRAAALDALAWQEDARMVIETTTWQRERQPDAMEPDQMAPSEP